VNRQQPNATKKMQTTQWAVGTITGYIIHSLTNYPNDRARLTRGWINFLVNARRNPALIAETLLRDRDAARFYTLDRWEMGYLRVFEPEEAQRRANARREDPEEEEDEEESME
jgi:hypothetical protein